MRRLLLTIATVLIVLTARGNTTVFDSFGPGNTYNPNLGFNVSPLGISAAQFTPGASGLLATVDLGLGFDFSQVTAGPVSVFLYGDAAGAPDNSNQTFLGSSGTPTVAFGQTNNSVVSLTVVGNVPVTMGSLYWLVLKPAEPVGPQMSDVWNASLATAGTTNFSTDGGLTWQPNGSTSPAFRVTAQGGAGVPDSGATIVLMLGSLVGLFALHRVSDVQVNV